MKLVRFDGWKMGLLVETSKGAYVLDVASSVRILSSHDGLSGLSSAGLINGMLADGAEGVGFP